MDSTTMKAITKFSFVCWMLFFVTASIHAQNLSISGLVTDSTGRPISGATLILRSPESIVQTQADGYYVFKNVLSGSYQIICFAPDKQLQSRTIQVNNVSITTNFSLTNLKQDLRTLEIESQREKTYGITRLRSVEDFVIYEGKKSEVIVIDELQANLATNNARQVYAKVTGLNIWESDGAGLQLGVGGRGLSPNRTASFNVRQNGYDISADALGYPESYYTPPTEALDRIEVVRGAASLQYGTQFGGLLNFRFKHGPSNKKVEWTSRQTLGSWNFLNSFNSIGGTIAKGRLNHFSFVQFKRGDGYRANSGFNYVNAYSSWKYSLTEHTLLHVDLTKMHYLSQQAGGLTDKNFEIDPLQSFRDRNWFLVDWNLASIQISHRFNSRTEVNLKSFGLLAKRSTVGNLERINVLDLGGNRTVIDGQFKNLGAELRGIHRYTLGKQMQVLALGARVYKGNTSARQGDGTSGSDANFTFLNPSNLENSDYTFPNLNLAFFAEHIFRLHERFSITPGIRWEYIQTASEGYYRNFLLDAAGNIVSDTRFEESLQRQRSFILAGLGLNYQIATEVNLYGNFSQNYRAINFSDLRIVNPNFVVDPNIRDEKGYTADLGIRGKLGKSINLEFTGFYITYLGKIGQILKTGQAPLYNDFRFRGNIADARNLGVESLIEWVIFDRDTGSRTTSLHVYSNLAFVDARYINSDDPSINGNRVEMVPPWIWRSGIEFQYKSTRITGQYAFTAEHFSDASNAVLTATAVEGIIPAYQIVDLSVSQSWKCWTLQLSVNNALNTSYFTRRAESYPGPGIIPADGRSIYITLQIKL